MQTENNEEVFVASNIVYPATVAYNDNAYLVTFRDIPEAITQGDDWHDTLEMAIDSLATALEFYYEDGRAVPAPSAFLHAELAIALSASDAEAVELHNAKVVKAA